MAPTLGVVSKLVDMEPVLAFGQPGDGPEDLDRTSTLYQRRVRQV